MLSYFPFERQFFFLTEDAIQGIPQFTCLKCLIISIIIMCAPCFWIFWNCTWFCVSSQNRSRTWTLDLRKNGPFGKIESQGLKTLSFFSSNMKDHVELIHFHVKSSGRFRANNLWKLHPKFESAKVRGSCAIVGLVSLAPRCHRAFVGPKIFPVGISWVENIFS